MAALALSLAQRAASQTVVDGNAISLDDKTYRLWSIDAPDPGQSCAHNWRAGQEAATALARMIDGKTVECKEKGRDREGRTVAQCTADGADLGAAMVRAGMAWADMSVSRVYVVEEAKAAAAYLGVHAHHCKTAWDWRAKNRPDPQFQRQ
jgi:endonuclease YncB( thermonuclease family)